MIDHAAFEATHRLIKITKELLTGRWFWKRPKKEIKADIETILDHMLQLLTAMQREAFKIERAANQRNRDNDELGLEDD